jgi:hypothetical protein
MWWYGIWLYGMVCYNGKLCGGIVWYVSSMPW